MGSEKHADAVDFLVPSERTACTPSMMDDAPSTSGADHFSRSTSEASAADGLFITHKVSKMDTLAGLAVRYNVPLADIKRFNGLLSDNAFYARDTILIPTRLVPLGEEVQMIFAQIAAGIGRDPVLNAEANLHPASAAVARVARTLNIVSGDSYPADDPENAPWWCQCGSCDEEEEASYPCHRRLANSGGAVGDVELIERNAHNTMFIAPGSSAGPTRFHEHVRRRKANTDEGPSEDELEWLNEMRHEDRVRMRPPTHPLMNGHTTGRPDTHTAHTLLASLTKAIGESSLVQKIKKAASQPALANASMHSFADAADGVLSSLKQGLIATSRGDTSSSNGPALPRSYNATATASKLKAKGKDE